MREEIDTATRLMRRSWWYYWPVLSVIGLTLLAVMLVFGVGFAVGYSTHASRVTVKGVNQYLESILSKAMNAQEQIRELCADRRIHCEGGSAE